MATFKVKTFNELSGKGQNGDIAIIERADINGNQGFTFRDASGWSLPFVQVTTLGANLMTTNTSQSVSAPKTFQGEVVINDDFSVIGATDIDLGFTDDLIIDGNSTGVIDVIGTSEINIDANSIIATTEKVYSNSSDTFSVQTTFNADANLARLAVSDKTPTRGVYIEYNNATNPSYQLVSATRDNVVLTSEYGADTSEFKLESNITTLTTDFFKVVGIPTYADNASAVLGGMATDMIYKTATGELRIVV